MYTALENFQALRYVLRNRLIMTPPPHEAVIKAFEKFGKPVDWHHLTLEEPIEKEGRVTYFRNDQKREAFKQTYNFDHRVIVNTEKYLKRHWPNVPDHEIRNLCAEFKSSYQFLTDIEEMVEAVINCESYSCMKEHDNDDHPYRVYDPKFGWKLAIAKTGDAITGRALVNDTEKVFVRTYGEKESNGKTQSHEGLHAWLVGQGYEFKNAWPEGLKFAKIRCGNEHLAPYLDPGSDRITSDDSRRVTEHRDYLVRNDCGEWTWENTNGTPSEVHSETCDDCGRSCGEDDLTYVGRHRDERVCDSCLESYTYAYGCRGDQYYVSNYEAVEVNGDYYHKDYLDDNDIVQLENGDYCTIDDAVECDGDWYHVDDIAHGEHSNGYIVEVDGEYVLKTDAVWCKSSSEWILESDAKSIGEGFVHMDDWDEYVCSLTLEEATAISEEALDTWKNENLQEKLELEVA